MHSVCPQIRLPAFNRLDASSCLAPFDKQLELFPASVPDSFPSPCVTSPFFFFFFFWRAGGGSWWRDSTAAVCRGPRLGASCVHLAPNVARGVLAHRWFVTSVTDTSGRSREKHPRVNDTFPACVFSLYEYFTLASTAKIY